MSLNGEIDHYVLSLSSGQSTVNFETDGPVESWECCSDNIEAFTIYILSVKACGRQFYDGEGGGCGPPAKVQLKSPPGSKYLSVILLSFYTFERNFFL